ncbi:MAG TPA: hypothetical protein VM901_05555 [Bdellovibrionota bacterium]|jgi:hypothetical protein|nr:hypothetical protein [Bdellovibrionota bacterium]
MRFLSLTLVTTTLALASLNAQATGMLRTPEGATSTKVSCYSEDFGYGMNNGLNFNGNETILNIYETDSNGETHPHRYENAKEQVNLRTETRTVVQVQRNYRTITLDVNLDQTDAQQMNAIYHEELDGAPSGTPIRYSCKVER